jgi:formate-dependent nitrite reductase cytochrome c552 subunit
MKLTGPPELLTTSLKALGIGALVASAAAFTYGSGSEARAASARSGTLPLIDWNCTSPGRVKPTSILLACGDGNARAVHLTWQQWGTRLANGRGDLTQNDCSPDCADGTFHTYPARFALSKTVPTAGQRYFTRVTVRFTDQGPSGRRREVLTDCFASPPAAFIPKCP